MSTVQFETGSPGVQAEVKQVQNQMGNFNKKAIAAVSRRRNTTAGLGSTQTAHTCTLIACSNRPIDCNCCVVFSSPTVYVTSSSPTVCVISSSLTVSFPSKPTVSFPLVPLFVSFPLAPLSVSFPLVPLWNFL